MVEAKIYFFMLHKGGGGGRKSSCCSFWANIFEPSTLLTLAERGPFPVERFFSFSEGSSYPVLVTPRFLIVGTN